MDPDVINIVGVPGFREPINCFSHLGGAAIFAALTVFLVRRGRGRWSRTVSLAVMGCSAVLLLSLSGVYHMLEVGTARDVMIRLDVAGVFVLIAGTTTPIHTMLFTGSAKWGVLVLVWCVAATGITLRMVFFEDLPSSVGTGLFVVLGWAGAASGVVLWRRYGFLFICPLIAGGIAYTLGAAILGLNQPTLLPGVIGPHELWHAAVLAGLGFHWRFVSQFASGTVPIVSTPSTIRS